MNLTEQMASAVDGTDIDLKHLTQVAQVRGTRLRRRRRAATITTLSVAIVLGVGVSVLVSHQSGPSEGAPSEPPFATSPATAADLDVDLTAMNRAPGQRLVETYLGPSRAVWDPTTKTAYVITRPWTGTTCSPAPQAVLTGGGTLELTLSRESGRTSDRECVRDGRHLIATVHGVDRAPTEAQITIETDQDIPGGALGPETVPFAGVVADDWDPAPLPEDIATSDFPRNSHGQTYGSSGMVPEYEDTPDLIATVATSGVVGFVLRTDMEVVGPSDEIPVYDFEGQVVIGYFPMAGGGEVRTICDGRPCEDWTPGQPRVKGPDD